MLTFYYHPLTCSLGVQIALLEVQAPHQLIKVDLMGDRSEYRKINSLGTVPALQTETGVLVESTAILAWLALEYPQARLLPKRADDFAHGLSFLAWLSSTVHVARRQARFPARFIANVASHAEVQAIGEQQIEQCLQRIDGLLASRRFVLEDEHPNACDYQLMAYANWCAIDGRTTADLPNFERWRNLMIQRPAVQEALRIIDSPLKR